MHCKICNSECDVLFSAEILQKYNISYFKCCHCGFIQTEQPYWLPEAYNNAITSLDVGYATRNLVYKDIVVAIIKRLFNYQSRFIDYGGGYGLFVRLMRDLGFDYYRQDIYCDNIFAKHFDIADVANNTNFDMLTAFEVFEHLKNPIDEIEKMLSYSKSILFSTTLQPANIKSVNDWNYFAPETGQHIAFYTKKALSVIAEKYNLNLYTNNKNLHLLTQKKMRFNCVKFVSFKHSLSDKLFGRNFCNKKSLIQKDVEIARKNIS